MPYSVRGIEEIGGFFDGLEPTERAEPGIVHVAHWHPDPRESVERRRRRRLRRGGMPAVVTRPDGRGAGDTVPTRIARPLIAPRVPLGH
ncbi:hypothetical protein GCM10011579_062390 [Streptomyces albiflavescens]|uniref:Uncharacterized protein n=1 Tax=Streptomyces albiflavescens TaxID=1623582 RepID=A0A918D850_9ACTN|nr:hypothetical protein [Streptomyces albiflavescens]GGN78821.1 hypothetical protein GCM10011579_062390 [Streptomyces albiflavescens]